MFIGWGPSVSGARGGQPPPPPTSHSHAIASQPHIRFPTWTGNKVKPVTVGAGSDNVWLVAG